MIFHLLPLCARQLQLSKAPLVVVVAPLLSLVEDQVVKVNKTTGLGKAVQLKQGAVYEKLREDEEIAFMFTSPEALLNSEDSKKLLLCDDFVERVVALVVDEAHCIAKWLVVISYWHHACYYLCL